MDLGDGDWVQLRTLTFGDRQVIQQVLLRTRTAKDLTFDGVDLDMATANFTMLYRAIAAWGGPGFGCDCGTKEAPHAPGCKVEPITRENIEKLDTTGDRLVDDIARMQASPNPKATKSEPESGTASLPVDPETPPLPTP